MLEEHINLLKNRRIELEKELSVIKKKLRYIKCNEYHKKEENKIFCDICDKFISKYVYQKHINASIHLSMLKMKEKYTLQPTLNS